MIGILAVGNRHLNPRVGEDFYALSTRALKWVEGPNHHPCDARGNYRVSAWTSASRVGARLKSAYEGGALRRLAGSRNGLGLGVWLSGTGVPALPHNLAVTCDDRADSRIWTHLSTGTQGQIACPGKQGALGRRWPASRGHAARIRSVRSPYVATGSGAPKMADADTMRSAPAARVDAAFVRPTPPST